MTERAASGDDIAPQQFRIGDLEIDTGSMRVSRSGTAIALPRLSFDLLIALARIAPRVATIDELMSVVWPGLVVGPETVSQRVKLLREALGDDSRRPRYIAVVRSRGYQMIAPVTVVDPGEAAPVTRPAPLRSRRGFLLIAGLAALAAVAAISWFAMRAPNAPPLARTQSIAVLPFTTLGAGPGDRILADGIAEAVLHKLANMAELAVIARTSSFAFRGRNLDVREIGRTLNARYVLEGAVQRDGEQLRVTAQLIDAHSGDRLWSLQFDEAQKKVFAVQDEIALRVATALELALDDGARRRMSGQGTENIAAYLAYLEGTQQLATWRLAETREAEGKFAQAIKADPAFPAAYVALARARVHLAEYDVTADRSVRFASAVEAAIALVEKAIALDPALGAAYAERAYLRAFSDIAAAERDYRHAIELSPSDARALQELAAVVWEDPARRPEALRWLDRARALDPLDPALDVTKAVYLFYGSGGVDEAQGLLLGVLARDPDYVPALGRLAELYGQVTGRIAEAIRILERAIAIDPQADHPRRLLTRMYLAVGDLRAAREVVAEAGDLPARFVPIPYFLREWPLAAQAARAAIESDTFDASDQNFATDSLRMEARVTRDYARAMALIEPLTPVSWSVDGRPLLGRLHGTWADTVALADLRILAGDRARGELLLQAVLVRIEHDVEVLGQASVWSDRPRATALALLGRDQEAIAALAGYYPRCPERWYWLETEPAFERLRTAPAFRDLYARTLARRDAEMAVLQGMRAKGLVVDRDSVRH